MFAIAALATMSFAFAPAFAAVYASASVKAPSSGWDSSNMDTISCGSGTCVAMVEVSASQDKAKIWYGMSGSNNTCDVISYTYGMGAPKVDNWGTISGLHSHTYSASIDSGDVITVATAYSNCS